MFRSVSHALPLLAIGSVAAAQQFQHSPGEFPGANWTGGVELADVDNDGDLDVLFADGEGSGAPIAPRQNVLMINQLVELGSLSFTDESVSRLGANAFYAKCVITGDVNGDGWVDLLYINAFNTDPPSLYINRGAAQPGFFDLESVARGFTTPLNSGGGQLGDVDDDGDLDVILCDSGPNFLQPPGGVPRLYVNDGTGHFVEDAAALNAPTKVAHMDVELADVDGDWDLDFLGVCRENNPGGDHYLMLNDGDGNFTDVSSQLPSTSNNVYEAEFGDLDGDDDQDLFFLALVQFQEGPVRNELVETGSLDFTAGIPLAGQVFDDEVCLFDYDNDGDYDIVVGSLGLNERLYLNQGGLDFLEDSANIDAINDSTQDASVGDLDNDGDYDIVTAQGESNVAEWNNKVFLNTGGADDLPPSVVAARVPAQAASWPAVLHARVRDQVRDDAQHFVTSRAEASPVSQTPVTVTLTGNNFVPGSVNVASGTSVVFDNQNGGVESITSATDPFTFDYTLAHGESVARVFVSPGTYDITSSGSAGSFQVIVSGSPTVVAGFAMGGLQHRFAIPQLAPTPTDSFAVELFFEDWAGNESVLDDGVVVYPAPLGTSYCGPAVPNSTGQPAEIAAVGSSFVSDGDVALLATQLPANKFGYFLVSRSAGFVANPGGSQGNLCLGGTIGRFNKFVMSSGGNGEIDVDVDVTNVPLLGAIQPGESWFFTAWYRDNNPGQTSNFTDGLQIDFL